MESTGIDLATGFGNRVAMQEAAAVAMATASRGGHAFGVAVIKLAGAEDSWARDHSISLAMRASLRATDQIFRIDDDTVVALLPMAAGRAVGAVVERAARLVDRPFSWGPAFAGIDGRSIDELVQRAMGRLRPSY
jgi:GGDEF domain-containing protein